MGWAAILRLIGPERWRLARLLGWMALLALSTAAFGALAGPALRAVFGGEALVWPAQLASWLPPPPTLSALRAWLPPVVVGVALVKAVASFGQTVGTAALGQAIVRRLRCRLHERVLRLPPDVAAAVGAGDLLSRGTHDADATERFFTIGLASALRDGLQAAALLSLCLLIDWRLTALALGLYPLALGPLVWFGRRLRRLARGEHARRAELAGAVHRQLGGLVRIQLSGAEPAAAAEHEGVARGVEQLSVRIAALRGIASPLMEVLGALALAGTMLYVGARIDGGQLAPEHVMSFLAGLLMLYQPVKGLVRAQGVMQPGLAALDRIDEIMRLPDNLPVGGTRPPPAGAPRIEVRGLELSRGGRPALRGVEAVFEPGQLTALVGPNGAGKTTLAWAMARLVEPSGGQILVDGSPLAELDARAWRRAVGWVTQDPLLGPGTLLENLGAGDASPEVLGRLASQVGLGSLLARLPAGWGTRLGDGGSGLSGGEKRRLSLARVLLQDPRVVVLDEPDAHLDRAAVLDLQSLLEQLRGGRTLILITHDPALARLADRVIYLEDGRVAARRAAA